MNRGKLFIRMIKLTNQQQKCYEAFWELDNDFHFNISEMEMLAYFLCEIVNQFSHDGIIKSKDLIDTSLNYIRFMSEKELLLNE